jgi:hypothetical protein
VASVAEKSWTSDGRSRAPLMDFSKKKYKMARSHRMKSVLLKSYWRVLPKANLAMKCGKPWETVPLGWSRLSSWHKGCGATGREP